MLAYAAPAAASLGIRRRHGLNYLHRFALEQVVTVNTAASGGDATLLSGEE
jgi:hypothetical protein